MVGSTIIPMWPGWRKCSKRAKISSLGSPRRKLFSCQTQYPLFFMIFQRCIKRICRCALTCKGPRFLGQILHWFPSQSLSPFDPTGKTLTAGGSPSNTLKYSSTRTTLMWISSTNSSPIQTLLKKYSLTDTLNHKLLPYSSRCIFFIHVLDLPSCISFFWLCF